jgi:hypothetical protein
MKSVRLLCATPVPLGAHHTSIQTDGHPLKARLMAPLRH